MRRRQPEQESSVPVELATFDPARWPDVGAWCEARRSWVEVHGYPGDPVDWIREQADAKRAAAGS